MKAVTVLIGVGIFIILLGLAIMPALTNFRGLDITAPYNVGAGDTSANVTLANDVLDDTTKNITVTSPEVADAPLPYDYISANHRLVINGLDGGTSRQLSVVYKTPRLESTTDAIVKWIPLILVIAGIAIAGGAAVEAWRNR